MNRPERPARQTGLAPVRDNQPPVPADRVLLVLNANGSESREIADHYAGRRRIPERNILRVLCPDGMYWKREEYRQALELPVRDRVLNDRNLEYVVLTRGIPYVFSDFGVEGGYSVDCVLATCAMAARPERKAKNPYYGKNARFSRRDNGGLLLVTRLDGLDASDAKRLVDSAKKARPVVGPFHLRHSFVMDMKAARDALAARGFVVEHVAGPDIPRAPRYHGSGGPFMAHWGAGPHDTQWSEGEYNSVRFLPGALCDLTWSVSAAWLHDPKSAGNIAVMVRNGAAGVQGYVSEPYADSLSRPEIVLDRYTRGYNLAESFSMGTPFLHWKQIVLGDPLCAPYAAASSPASGKP